MTHQPIKSVLFDLDNTLVDRATAFGQAFERYAQEVDNADLKAKTKETYIGRTEQFVRWLGDDFPPGLIGRRHKASSP